MDAYAVWRTRQLAAASEATHLCALEAHLLKKTVIQNWHPTILSSPSSQVIKLDHIL